MDIFIKLTGDRIQNEIFTYYNPNNLKVNQNKEWYNSSNKITLPIKVGMLEENKFYENFIKLIFFIFASGPLRQGETQKQGE